MFWGSDKYDEITGEWPGMPYLPCSSDDSDSLDETDSSEETESSGEPDSSDEPDSTEELDSLEELPIRKKRKKDSPKEQRNWLELPRDVMSLIFVKLGATHILLRAQAVCSAWRKLSKEPHLFRSVDMRNEWDYYLDYGDEMAKLAREAVNRSRGQMVEFSVEHFADDELLQYIIHKSCSLRCLRLVSCYQCSDEGLIEIAKKSPMLEELEICHFSFSHEAFEGVGQVCPQLKYFRLNQMAYKDLDIMGAEDMDYNEEALAIAKNMPQLRRLHLFGNMLSNTGLKAILDGCRYLESLDLRQCFYVKLEGDMLKRCADAGIKLRLPEDSTDDYEFDASTDGGLNRDPSPPESSYWDYNDFW